MKKAVIITGALGGIGKELYRTFKESKFEVIGLDKAAVDAGDGNLLRVDIAQCAESPASRDRLIARIREILNTREMSLIGLVNNAAVQNLGCVDSLTHAAWDETLKVNLLAPFFLSQAFLPELEGNQGAVINISSIHESLTKKNFVAYATSKAALSGLTRAMAVDLGARVRVNAICTAAIETSMLKAGFEGNPDGYEALKKVHPVDRIGTPHEVAKLCLYLVCEAPGFLTGSTIGMDGGVASRLHDPA